MPICAAAMACGYLNSKRAGGRLRMASGVSLFASASNCASRAGLADFGSGTTQKLLDFLRVWISDQSV